MFEDPQDDTSQGSTGAVGTVDLWGPDPPCSPEEQDDPPSDSSAAVDACDAKPHQDRVAQLSTPTRNHQLLEYVRALRTEVASTDACLVIGTDMFLVHSFVVSSSSKVLARALNPLKADGTLVPSKVAIVEGVSGDIMNLLLDYMYCNLAILKESQLLDFLKAARRLEIEDLQTPGLQKLESNLATSSSSAPKTEDDKESHGKSEGSAQSSSSKPKIPKFPNSLIVKDQNGKVLTPGSSQEHQHLGSPEQKEAEKETRQKSSNDECHKCCHCNCKRESHGGEKKRGIEETDDCSESPEDARGKKRENKSTKDDEKESLMNRLQKLGTMITSPTSTGSLLDIPAWLFTSKNISITPHKEPLRLKDVPSATLTEESSNKKSSQQKNEDSDADIIIDSPPRKSVRKNLVPSFQACNQQQMGGQVARLQSPQQASPIFNPRARDPRPQQSLRPTDMSPRNRGPRPVFGSPGMRQQSPYGQQMQTEARIGYIPRPKFRGYAPPPAGPRVQTERKPYISPMSSVDTKLRQQPEVVSEQHTGIGHTPLGPQGNRGQNPSYMGQTSKTPLTSTPSTSRFQTPTASFHQTPIPPTSQTPMPPLSQIRPPKARRGRGRPPRSDKLESKFQQPLVPKTILWDGKSPLEIMDTGVVVELMDSAAEVITGTALPSPMDATPGSDLPPLSSILAPPGAPTAEDQSLSSTGQGDANGATSSEALPEDAKECDSQDDTAAEGETKLSDHQQAPESTSTEPVQQHSRRKTFRCGVCHNMFATAGAMLLHKRRHAGERPYYCSTCKFRTGSLAALESHVRAKHRRKSLRESEKVQHTVPQVLPHSRRKKKKGEDKGESKDGEEGRDGEKGGGEGGAGDAGRGEDGGEGEEGKPADEEGKGAAEEPEEVEKRSEENGEGPAAGK